MSLSRMRDGTTAVQHSSASDRIEDLAVRTARGAPWVAASALVSRGLLAGVVLVLAAVLSPYEFGVLSIALLLSTVFTVLVDVGFATALVFEQDEVEEAAASAMGVSVVVGVSVGIGLLITADAVSEIFRVPDAAPLIRAYAGIIVLSGVVAIPLMRLNREFAFRRRFTVETLPLIAGSILTIVLAIEGVGVLVSGDRRRDALPPDLDARLGDRALRIRPRWHPRTVARLWPYARGATIASILDIVLLNVDYALVARLLGATALGFYSLGFRIAIIPFYVVTMVVVGAGWPAMTRLRADDAHLTSAFRISVRVASGGVMLFAGATIVLAPWLVLLSPDWESAVSVTRLLAVFVVLRSACYLLQAYFQSVGRTGLNAALRAIWLVLLVCLIATVGRRGVDAIAGIQVVVAAVLCDARDRQPKDRQRTRRTVPGRRVPARISERRRGIVGLSCRPSCRMVGAPLPRGPPSSARGRCSSSSTSLRFVPSPRLCSAIFGRVRHRLTSRNRDRMQHPRARG